LQRQLNPMRQALAMRQAQAIHRTNHPMLTAATAIHPIQIVQMAPTVHPRKRANLNKFHTLEAADQRLQLENSLSANRHMYMAMKNKRLANLITYVSYSGHTNKWWFHCQEQIEQWRA